MSPSATELVAALVRERVPGWVEDHVHRFVFVFGDPHADAPGRHIVCDGLTDHPIVVANVHGIRMTLELPHVSDSGDRRTVIEALEAVGAIDPTGR